MKTETLAKYKKWADKLLYSCISKLPERELKKDRAMLFDNILSLMHHVYAMDTVWKSHLNGIQHNLQSRNPDVEISFQDLRNKQYEINDWYENYFSNLALEKHTESISFNFIGGGFGNMTRAEIMHHTVNHSTYHRGHIEGVLYQLSIEPPTTDLPVFLRLLSHG